MNAVRDLSSDARYELFVQRGEAGPRFGDLPGEDFISRTDFERRLLWADRVVIHGGAGSLYEAVTLGHTPVVMPRLRCYGEIVNDHQLELVEALSLSEQVRLCAAPEHLASTVLGAPDRRRDASASDNPLQIAVREALVADRMPTRQRPFGVRAWHVARGLAGRSSRT